MREETITIKVEDFLTTFGDKKQVISAVVSENLLSRTYLPEVLKEFSAKVVDELTKTWIAKHGEATLEQLAPGAIAQIIRDKVAARVLEGK